MTVKTHEQHVDFEGVARDGVVELRPYIPGKPLEEVREEFGLEKVIKLASNECPFPPPQEMMTQIMAEADAIRRYPDGFCRKLGAKLSEVQGIPQENILFANGAEECIRLIAQTFLNPSDNVVLPEPIFDAYETATILTGAKPRFVPLSHYEIDLDAIVAAVDRNTKLIWLCSPANPTGKVLKKQAVELFLSQLPSQVLVVVDEAYREFVTSPDAVHAEDFLQTDQRVIGLRTFSKAYGIAGLRVGYIVAHPQCIALISKVKLPFNVNVMAQAAAIYHLDHPEFTQSHVAAITTERERMIQEFTKRNMSVVRSETNFLLVEVPKAVDVLYQELLQCGFIIRPGSIWGFERYMRYTIGAKSENDAFLASFDGILSA